MDNSRAELLGYSVGIPIDRLLTLFGSVLAATRTLRARGVQAGFILIGTVAGTAYTEQIHWSITTLGLAERIRVISSEPTSSGCRS